MILPPPPLAAPAPACWIWTSQGLDRNPEDNLPLACLVIESFFLALCRYGFNAFAFQYIANGYSVHGTRVHFYIHDGTLICNHCHDFLDDDSKVEAVGDYFHTSVEEWMADEAPARVEEMEDQDQEAPPVPDPAAPDPKQDDVKPVVFIGLFLTALFVMGNSPDIRLWNQDF